MYVLFSWVTAEKVKPNDKFLGYSMMLFQLNRLYSVRLGGKIIMNVSRQGFERSGQQIFQDFMPAFIWTDRGRHKTTVVEN
jgi:hypothetical protein